MLDFDKMLTKVRLTAYDAKAEEEHRKMVAGLFVDGVRSTLASSIGKECLRWSEKVYADTPKKGELLPRKRESLLIAGSTGVGKTTCAAHALLDLAKRHCNSACSPDEWLCPMRASLLLSKLASFETRDETMHVVRCAPVLFVDDVYNEMADENGFSLFEAAMDYRYQQQMTVVLTTNMDNKVLRNGSGTRWERLVSRWWQQCSWLFLMGPDKRKH